MKRLIVLLMVVAVSGLTFADLNPYRVLPGEIVGRYSSNNISSYWGMTPDDVVDRSGLVDASETLHNKVASDQAMFEKRDWNTWNHNNGVDYYCVYQTNDHPFWPGDAGTVNANFVDVPVETNWVRDNPGRTNPDVNPIYSDGYEYNCTMAWLLYEFDSVKSLDDMLVWNFSEGGDQNRGWQSVDIHYTLDGSEWFLLQGPEYDNGFRLSKSPTDDPFGVTDIIDLNIDAAAICLTAYSNWDNADAQLAGWGVTNTGGGWNGIAEVQFNQVPEPASMALLALGSLLLRRKR